MRFPKLRDWLLPLLLLAFVGSAITFLQPMFNETTRWVVLLVVAAYLLVKGQLTSPLRFYFGLLTLTSVFWALATSAWSEVPELSYLKAMAFLLIAFAGIALGHFWVRQRPVGDCLNYLLPLTVCTLAAGLVGHVSETAVVEAGSATLYQGSVGGPNMFGTMLAMCFPLVAWQVYRFWPGKRARTLWLLAMAVVIYYLLASGSRGAMLVVVCVVLGLFLSLGLGPRLQVVVFGLALAAATMLLFPGQTQPLVNAVLYKQVSADEGVFYSREEIWGESYEAAERGGWLGGGFGVSIGDAGFKGGVTAVGYGREKGNSHLSIVEETGLVGLAIYLLLIGSLLARLGSAWHRLPPGTDKVLLGIVSGALLGMIAHSGVEAWWYAPASPESVYFWTLSGVGLALSVIKRVPTTQDTRSAAVPRRSSL